MHAPDQWPAPAGVPFHSLRTRTHGPTHPDPDPRAAQCKAALSQTQGQQPDPELSSAVVASFASYQQRAQASYDESIKGVLAEKAKMEKELGEEIDFKFPQQGGTTATVVVLHANGVLAAWAGDSRAVAGLKEEGGAWRAEALSVDHSVNDPKEKARVLEAGGQTASKSAEDGKLLRFAGRVARAQKMLILDSDLQVR